MSKRSVFLVNFFTAKFIKLISLEVELYIILRNIFGSTVIGFIILLLGPGESKVVMYKSHQFIPT